MVRLLGARDGQQRKYPTAKRPNLKSKRKGKLINLEKIQKLKITPKI